MAKLTFVLEDGEEVVVPLKEHIIIGRDEDNDIMVDDERISPRHAEIVQNADGSLQVFDLKSSTGTYVNGERQISCTLLHGDTIAFGPLVGTLDLEHPATSPSIDPASAAPPVSTSASAPAPETPAPETPAPEALPSSPAPPPADTAHIDAMARMEAEKARLKAEVDAVEKELRDWQQRAENERALHLARVESLRAEEEKLAPIKASLQQAETAHHDWLEAINALTSQHADKTAALERLNSQHYEKSTEVQRLTATAAAAQQEIDALTAQKAEADARLKQVRDECEQDEALLNSLRQQIIEHEKRIVEEEARHASLNSATAELTAKHQRDEAAVKDLESLLMSLEQRGAAAEASLQRQQEELATCEKALAARNAEFAACKASIATTTAELATETSRLAEAKAMRVELSQVNQELAAAKQQLVDARQRLAAVEQRYRDALAHDSHGGAQIAPPRRPASHEGEPKVAAATNGQHGELSAQIEAARRELADLETKIASLHQSSAGEPSQDSSSISPPVVVHVETIRLAPVPIKSERTRGPGTKSTAGKAGSGRTR